MDLQVKHCVISNVVSHQGPKDKAIGIAAEGTGDTFRLGFPPGHKFLLGLIFLEKITTIRKGHGFKTTIKITIWQQ